MRDVSALLESLDALPAALPEPPPYRDPRAGMSSEIRAEDGTEHRPGLRSDLRAWIDWSCAVRELPLFDHVRGTSVADKTRSEADWWLAE
jgi:hypothetical protein